MVILMEFQNAVILFGYKSTGFPWWPQYQAEDDRIWNSPKLKGGCVMKVQ